MLLRSWRVLRETAKRTSSPPCDLGREKDIAPMCDFLKLCSRERTTNRRSIENLHNPFMRVQKLSSARSIFIASLKSIIRRCCFWRFTNSS